MRLLILGATGRTGRRVVERALAQGHGVTALVRRPGSAPSGATEIVGDVTDAGTLKESLTGNDSILIALSGGPDQGYEILGRAAGAAAEALEAAGLARLVMVSHIGVLDSPQGGLRGDRFSDEFKPIFLGHQAAFEALQRSHVDWTLVCPPNLPDGPPTGDFEYEIEGLPTGIGDKAFTGDVAHLMIQVLDEPSTFQKRLGIVSRQPG